MHNTLVIPGDSPNCLGQQDSYGPYLFHRFFTRDSRRLPAALRLGLDHPYGERDSSR